MSLEETFYILGIIVMSIMLVVMIVLTAAVIVIRNKINHIHHAIDDKLSIITNVADVAKRVVSK